MRTSPPDWFGQHHLFAPLEAADLARVLDSATPTRLDAGEELFSHGTPARRFYILEDGGVLLYRLSPAGEEKVIEIIQPRQSFAEAVMFMDGQRYPVSARALVDSAVWGFEMKTYRTLLEASPALCLKLLGRMSQRLHQLLQEVDQLSLNNARMRVVQYLLDAAPDGKPDQYQVQWDTPKQILASRLSVRPETFSRILQRLSQSGAIRVQGKVVTVLDAERLRTCE
jgi:CRP-like cAMP-binding protein